MLCRKVIKMQMTKEKMLRDAELAYQVTEIFGVRNRLPRNKEYAGPHSDTQTKKALELAEKYRQKVPCGPHHFVYPSGLIGRRGKIKNG